MRRTAWMFLPLLTVSLLAVACEEDSTEPDETFDLVFRGDATFQGPHGDQTVTVALVQNGVVLETETATVSGTANPAFSVTFDEALDEGESYQIHYWIDANFAGGTEGECDAPPVDHMWSLNIGPVDEDITMTEDHDVTNLVDVCGSFD